MSLLEKDEQAMLYSIYKPSVFMRSCHIYKQVMYK